MTDAPPKHFPDRWRLSRAGIVNVWHYLENTFDLSGGRMILRGTNGSGKSRALEMLLPFLLDADRRKMDATGSGRVNLDELMRAGADEQANRTGYLWLELEADDRYLTIGALIRHSRSAKSTQVWYFMTSLRVGHDLMLLTEHREPLRREALSEMIGAHAITDSAETHRERVRTTVFGLSGDNGRDRYLGLLQLLHTLRSPDVGNRIDEGRLPQILSDALPPLAEHTLTRAGEQLDGLTTLRQSQQRLEDSLGHVTTFLDVYRRYAATTLLDTATETLRTVDDLTAAERAGAERDADVTRLHEQRAAKQVDAEQRQAQVDELHHAIEGIRGREIFKQADDLVQRDKLVETLASAAAGALAEAGRERGNHGAAAEQASERLDDLRAAVESAAATLAASGTALRAANLADAALPAEVRLVVRADGAQQVPVRTSIDGEPEAVTRAGVPRATVLPGDLVAAQPGVQTATAAANKRRELAERRQQEAIRLAAAEQQVLRLEGDAAGAAAQAEADLAQSDADAQARDDMAIELATDWRAWIAHADTAALLGEIGWAADEPVAPLLLDLEALCGEDGDQLTGLDAAAARHARAATDAIATAQGELERAQRDDEQRRAGLGDEAAALRRAEAPAPPEPPWLAAARPGVPLWRAVDFADGLADTERAGLEAALLASGLLTASIEADGSVLADDGTTLLSPYHRAVGRRLSEVLVPDPAGALDPALVARVLDGIGLDGIGLGTDGSSGVATDGSWQHGPLRGRHAVPAARHIGAAARAQARRERLAAIDAELADLDTRAEQRRVHRADLDERRNRIDRHVESAPRSGDLHQARGIARASAERAIRSGDAARSARRRARAERATWAGELETHRTTSELHGLPVGAAELGGVVAAARRAATECAALARGLHEAATRLRRYEQSVTRVDEQAARCTDAEARADTQWRAWRDMAAEVAALHQAIDLTVEEARDELQRSVTEHETAVGHARRVQRELHELGPAVGTAEADARHAAQLVEQRRAQLIAAAQRFNRRVVSPGLVAAASDGPIISIAAVDRADSVRETVRSALDQVDQPARPADENAVLRAFQHFDREVSGQLDVAHTVDDGIALVTVVGAGANRTLAGAAAALGERAATGRAALSEREREVFTTFVLGGVAEELRRRINQASTLVGEMNTSLRMIRTSNGIGVRLSWHLSDDSPALRRIAELVRTADAVRSPTQNAELTDLLRRRVDESYESDPSSGYAVHLANALDYRRWHNVAVTILGPDHNQERRLSTRAKLSQGETRFVSYVTLFAAADAYLSGLSDSGRQLRLILLDDAFAKVDDPTIAELMGLLVRLDLDFVMTGHALWGCFPQVPKLDVYEVRRQEGTSAVTTHVHWDGHTRHLRSTA